MRVLKAEPSQRLSSQIGRGSYLEWIGKANKLEIEDYRDQKLFRLTWLTKAVSDFKIIFLWTQMIQQLYQRQYHFLNRII